MQLMVYSPAMDALGMLEAYRSLIWTRRYQTPGEVRLLTPYRSEDARHLTQGNLLMLRGGSEAVEIEYVGMMQTPDGEEMIEVSGRTLMCWLERRHTIRQVVASGRVAHELLFQLFAENMTAPADDKRRFPNTTVQVVRAPQVIEDYASQERALLIDTVGDLLTTLDLGLSVSTDTAAKTHCITVYQGLDRTVEQTYQEPCIFSAELDVLGAHSFISATEGYRNVAYVYGADHTAVIGDAFAGVQRREVVVEASDIAQTYTDENGESVTITQTQLNNALKQRGLQQLSSLRPEQTLTAALTPDTPLHYGTDFDLGDRVTCLDRRWGVAMNARITEITQVWQNNEATLELVFGEGTPSLRAALRNYAKGR